MAATALLASIFYPSSFPKASSIISFKSNLQNPSPKKLILCTLFTTKTHVNHLGLVARDPISTKLCCSPAQGTTLEAVPEEPKVVNKRRKLYVSNLPWKFSVQKLKELFGECGTITDVEFIKNKDENGRNFGFVTMASGEEAQAVLDKFDSYEVGGRIIRVEFSKKFKKSPPKLLKPFVKELEYNHQVYVSNLAWKVRGIHLRDFFAESMNPVSCRVIFDESRSAGYGFASFSTKEEAEAAISAFDGKELMGRPVRLTLNDKKKVKNGSESQGEDNSVIQADSGSESLGEENSETQAEEQ